MTCTRLVVVLVLFIAGVCCAAPIPTFEKLDKELTKYKYRADLTGKSNAHLQMDGLAFHCMFDLFLAVMQDPDHPKYEETKKAWDNNYDMFSKQAGFIAQFMGHNLFPLLITTSAAYATGFKEGAALYAPRFEPKDYFQPLAIEICMGGKTDKVAWWHGAADADGDGISNAEELKIAVPKWDMITVADSRQGSEYGVTKADRELFISKALYSPQRLNDESKAEVHPEAQGK